jgi:hypothetical protein
MVKSLDKNKNRMAKTKSKRVARAEKQAKQENATPQATAFEDVLFGWYAPEFIRFERSWKWYAIASLLDALLIAYAVWTEAWTMAVVFLLLGFVVAIDLQRKPKMMAVMVSHWGIQFGDLKIPFTEIKRFWIYHQPPHVDELRLQTQSKIHPEVVIPLNGANPSLIRQYLVTQIPEWEGKHMSLLDVIIRLLRLH